MQYLHIPAHMPPTPADGVIVREHPHFPSGRHQDRPGLLDRRLEMTVSGDYCLAVRGNEARRATGGKAFGTGHGFLSERDPIAKRQNGGSIPMDQKNIIVGCAHCGAMPKEEFQRQLVPLL